MSQIIIVQHCQSEHHINDLTGGWTDTPLTDFGVEQAHAVAKELESMNLSNLVLYTSDLKRAKMTAEIISDCCNTHSIIDKNLREINNGVAKNQTKEWADKNKRFKTSTLLVDEPLWEDAETPRELYQRIQHFVHTHLQHQTHDIIVVSHGIAIGYLISVWLGIPVERMSEVFFRGNPGGISCLYRNSFHQNVLTQYNSTAHLPKK